MQSVQIGRKDHTPSRACAMNDDDATHLTAVTIQRGTPTGERGTYRLVLDVTEEQS